MINNNIQNHLQFHFPLILKNYFHQKKTAIFKAQFKAVYKELPLK